LIEYRTVLAGGMTKDGLLSMPDNIITPQQLLNCGWIYEK
jgi:hypothetical protein